MSSLATDGPGGGLATAGSRTEADERAEARLEFASQLRRFLDQHAALSTCRKTALLDGRYDVHVWKRLSEEFAVTRLHVPEAHGGEGFGLEELAVLLAETGRVLLPSPLLSSATMATYMLLELDRGSKDDELLAKLARSEVTATVALVEPGSDWDPRTIQMLAEERGSQVELSGEKIAVLDETADVILTIARRPGSGGDEGVIVAEVARNAPGLETRRTASLDLTRPVHSLRFNRVRARTIGDPNGRHAAAISAALNRSVVGLAAEMIGGARQCLESAVSHAQTRRQFGRPIGSFQAIKHRCADMLAEIELAQAIVAEASVAVDRSAESSTTVASIAKLQASRAYLSAALGALHVHGAMGFTWEHDAHLYVRRAKASDLFLGNRQFHRRRVVQGLRLTSGAAPGLALPSAYAADEERQEHV